MMAGLCSITRATASSSVSLEAQRAKSRSALRRLRRELVDVELDLRAAASNKMAKEIVQNRLQPLWDAGDAVVWDNRRLMHRGTPFDMTQPRRMWHTRIAGEPESELAANHA